MWDRCIDLLRDSEPMLVWRLARQLWPMSGLFIFYVYDPLSLSLSVLPYFYHSPRICIYYFAYTIKYHPTEIVHSVGSFCPREKNCFTAFAFTDKGSQKWGQNSHPF